MRLISKLQEIRARCLGRLSDGSDATTVQDTVWIVTLIDDDLKTLVLEFDHDPTSQEIVDVLPRPTEIVPTKKIDLETYLQLPYERWQRWKATRIEAQARAMPGNVITALTNKENAVWTEYANAISTWRTAP